MYYITLTQSSEFAKLEDEWFGTEINQFWD